MTRPSCQYRLAAVGVLALLAPSPALADPWHQPTETVTNSRSGEYRLRVSPSTSLPRSFGNCAAEFYRMEEGDPILLWSRHLINNVMPVRTFVTDSGKYVVTMEEWYRRGEFPVVIYGDRGQLIKVHDKDSLKLLADAISRLDIDIWASWSQYAVVFFGRNEETFIIRLCWGRMIMLRLADGQLLDEDWADHMGKGIELRSLHEFATRRVQEVALELLQSPQPDDRVTGTLVARDYRLRRAKPLLQALLSDPSTLIQYTAPVEDPSARRVVYYIREAAQEAMDAIAAAPTTQPASGDDSETPFATEDPPLRTFQEAIPPWDRPGHTLYERAAWTPFINQSQAQRTAIARLFGVELQGCLIARARPHAVALRDGLRVNDRIVAVEGKPVTDRTLWAVLSGVSPDAISLRVQREEGTAEVVVHPIQPPPDLLKPFRCLGKRITELSPDSATNERRSRWLTALGPERKLTILSCWGNDPGSWMASLDRLVDRLQDGGLRWLTVGCPTEGDEEKWKAAIAANPVRAEHVQDQELYLDLGIRYGGWPTHLILDPDGTVLYCQLDEFGVPAAVKGLLGVK